jgi:Na+-transporting methylmalonyl-CoA/oxaloacetate decarboxylase gamma subunit
MSRASYLIVAVVLGVVAVFWWFAKWFLVVGSAMEKDSAPGGADVTGVLAFWGIIFVSILLCLLWCLTRAFSSVRRDSGSLPSQPSQPQKSQKLATPDEKLAHLVKKP